MDAPQPRTIPLSSISADDRLSLHRGLKTAHDDGLGESIERFGVLHPPIVREERAGSYLIVSGSRRVEALRRRSGIGSVTCLVLSDRRLPEPELLSLIAEDQRLSGPLSPIETARLIQLCETLCPEMDTTTTESIARVIGTVRMGRIRRLLDLEEPIRTDIHTGAIALSTAAALLNLEPSERLFLRDLFARLKFNPNKQRRVMEEVRIVAARERCSITVVFDTHFPWLRERLPENIPQTGSRLLRELHDLSHPLSTAAERRFADRVRRLRLPEHCSLTPSPAFERDTVTFSVDFADLEEFESSWPKLRRNV